MATQHRHPLRRSSTAFTLVELLVVISIIAVLVAVLLPAIGAARESARRAICMSNMRQYHLGAEAFANANETFYPGLINHGQSATGTSEFRNSDYPNRKSFMLPYSQYLDEYLPKAITLCPSAPERAWPWMPYGNLTTEWYQKQLDARRQNWQVNATDGTFGTITDYSIRMGFGSNHGGVDPDKYRKNDPNYYRGHHKGIYPRWRKGFVFVYQQDQADVHPDNIMLMDRQRAPTDPQDGTRYQLIRANHNTRTGPEAAGSNTLRPDGSVRWMDLTRVWGSNNWTGSSPNYFGRVCYGEGNYYQFVDDTIAENF